jgi:hypothetical protein
MRDSIVEEEILPEKINIIKTLKISISETMGKKSKLPDFVAQVFLETH